MPFPMVEKIALLFLAMEDGPSIVVLCLLHIVAIELWSRATWNLQSEFARDTLRDFFVFCKNPLHKLLRGFVRLRVVLKWCVDPKVCVQRKEVQKSRSPKRWSNHFEKHLYFHAEKLPTWTKLGKSDKWTKKESSGHSQVSTLSRANIIPCKAVSSLPNKMYIPQL